MLNNLSFYQKTSSMVFIGYTSSLSTFDFTLGIWLIGGFFGITSNYWPCGLIWFPKLAWG